ncbi:MAG: hypothetical protein ACR2MX_16095 [Cyclobacteriaceae bacterium]
MPFPLPSLLPNPPSLKLQPAQNAKSVLCVYKENEVIVLMDVKANAQTMNPTLTPSYLNLPSRNASDGQGITQPLYNINIV